MAGWLPITDIICLIRAGRLTTEPMATSAVSLVPRASTQQPRYPSWTSCWATVEAFAWPLEVSTIEVPPEISEMNLVTPTRAYCAPIRRRGLGR